MRKLYVPNDDRRIFYIPYSSEEYNTVTVDYDVRCFVINSNNKDIRENGLNIDDILEWGINNVDPKYFDDWGWINTVAQKNLDWGTISG